MSTIKTKSKPKTNRLTLPWYLVLPIYLILSGCILVFTTALQKGAVLHTLQNYLAQPLLLALNLLPILAVLGLLYAIFGNIFYAGSVTSLLFHLLSLVNLIKIEGRKDPLVPADFALITEAMEATESYQLDLHLPYLAAIVAVALALFVLGLFFKSKPRPWQRITAAVLAVLVMTGAMIKLYPDHATHDRLVHKIEGLSPNNYPLVFDETGFVYNYLHLFRLYAVDKPAQYDTKTAESWASAETTLPDDRLSPDLIFIQSEAYSDLFSAPDFDYPETENPQYLFDQVASGPQALRGDIVVSQYGAGTDTTEFDVMTGVETNLLSPTMSSSFRAVHKNLPTLARTLLSDAYVGYFMHPGDRWFYSRESVYSYFGLDDQTYIEDFAGEQWKGCFIADAAFGRRLRADYEAHLAESDAPWFAYTVTIQNHQAYPWKKYAVKPEDAKVSHPVSDETMEALSVYAEGVRDSSQLLWDLTAYFDEQTRPVVLVFWGDHLPNLGSGFTVWQEVGLDIGNERELSSALDTYTTPFVLWANRAFCEQYDFAARVAALELPEDHRISDIFLGELVYELCARQGSDPYFDFLGQLRRELPVISKGRYALMDGTLTEALTDAQQPLVDKLQCWGYYRVIEQKID